MNDQFALQQQNQAQNMPQAPSPQAQPQQQPGQAPQPQTDGQTVPPKLMEQIQKNLQYAQPSDTNYQTNLPPDQESAFREWLDKNQHLDPVKNFNPDASMSDYDMRGFWKEQQEKPESTEQNQGVDPNDGKMHFTDKYKTPAHESFSRESQYANDKAPVWSGKGKNQILIDPKSRQVMFNPAQKQFDDAWKDQNSSNADQVQR